MVAIPLFRRLRLGSVLGYLAAGLAIGPLGPGLFNEPQAILHVAELGVVMFLFVIGLEMRPSYLWSLRKQIFGLGTAQIAVCTLVLTGIGMLLGVVPPVAFVAASGFVLTSTAVVVQLLAERGDVALPPGQKIVAILLFEDLFDLAAAGDRGLDGFQRPPAGAVSAGRTSASVWSASWASWSKGAGCLIPCSGFWLRPSGAADAQRP